MESDSRFSYGGEPSSLRMDRSTMDQFVAVPQHSTLTQPRMATGVVNPLDLTSAIQHELRRANSHPGWAAWNQQQQQFGGSQSFAASPGADCTGFSIPYGSFHSGVEAAPQQIIPQYIPRFDEGLGPGLHHMPTRFEFNPETEYLGSARQEFYSGSSRSASGFEPSHSAQQVFETGSRVDSMRSCSPWIERMMQADVTPTPSPINLCLSTSQRTTADVSCVLSHTVDLNSCHSSDRQAQSMRSAFSSDPQHESAVELSADVCSDDDDLETRPMDVKRKKRMLSNRASAQRSRQRRQERLDQLEVLTAKLRVENSTLQKKLTAAVQLAKKFDDQNKELLKKVDRLGKKLEVGCKRARKLSSANFNDCSSSQQTACASSCEMVGERAGMDPNAMRDVNMSNDGAGSTGTPSLSPSGSPRGWPLGNRSPAENNDSVGISPVRRSFAACRMETKKRPHDQPDGGFGETSPVTPEPGRAWHEVCCNPPQGLDNGGLKEDGNVDCLEADRWLNFSEWFL